jgi:hypothetical protein
MTPSIGKPAKPVLTAPAASSVTFVKGLGSRAADTAANDAAAAEPSSADGNPLWIIPIGMAYFFAVAAAVMALS